MNASSTMSPAAQMLHEVCGSHNVTVTGVPDSLTWDGAQPIARELMRELTRNSAPEVIAAIERGDFAAAADLFLERFGS